MHVDSTTTVAGYPVLLVRQALRKLRHIDTWGSGMLEADAGLPPGAGPELAKALAAQGLIHQWTATPKVAMAASCLLLVPGVPLINSVSDMVKGYINTGISRWAFATLLTVATCAGIILAMTVWRVWAWL